MSPAEIERIVKAICLVQLSATPGRIVEIVRYVSAGTTCPKEIYKAIDKVSTETFPPKK